MYIHQAQIPLVRIAIPFIAGILLSITTGLKINGPVFYSTSLSLLLLLFLVNKYVTDYKYKNLFGIALCVLLLLLGLKICQQYNQLENPNHFSYYGNRDDYALLQLTSPVSEKPNSFQLKAKVTSIANDSMYNSVSGNIIIYLEKCPDAEKLKYGDIIITKNDFQETRPPSNPNEFNYKRFLAYSNIHHQAYRSSDDWQFTGKNSGNQFIKATHKLRDKSLEILKSNNISGKEYAVASALVLGYREYLDDELRQGFAGAGAMHVLCVSGLHVGIIFLILNTIFSFLTKIKRGEIIKALIIILIIWLYAAITGFSPSVQRASTMFTFMAIGSSFKRKTNIYNTLAASALFLLIINPYLITKIGFQLSYLAVIGIVALQPAFYKHIIFKNKILDKAWAIITVSVAAQLATGPLGIYYFNQFPNYFILTNLAVIPLASLIIYAALFVIILSPIHILASLFGRILSFCVKILNYIVVSIESLPGSVSSDIHISLHEVFLIITIIILFTYAFMTKSKLFFKLSLISIFVLISSFSYRKVKNYNNNMFVVYNINNSTAIDFFSNNETHFISCNSLMNEGKKIDFHIRENRIKNGNKKTNHLNINENKKYISENFIKTGDLILFNNYIFYILTTDNEDIIFNDMINIDYLIISQNPNTKPSELLETLIPQNIIIDSSNNYFTGLNWVEASKSNNISYQDIKKSGAYSKTL